MKNLITTALLGFLCVASGKQELSDNKIGVHGIKDKGYKKIEDLPAGGFKWESLPASFNKMS